MEVRTECAAQQRFSETGVRDTVSTDCKRNGEAAPCGTFFIVNDYLPKPIAMIDSAGRLAGVGEYDAFGRVNTVSMRADAPAYTDVPPYPFGKYKVSQGAIANFTVPLRGGAAGRARVNYALVNTTNASDITDVRAGTKCSSGTSMVKGGYQGQLNSFATPWFGVTSGTPYCVWWAAYAEGGYGGAVTASYEYQLFENSVATPSWLPLRFPGQYADGESQFFENWNRFYDMATGRYVGADVELPRVGFSGGFGYADGNPIEITDKRGAAPDSLVRKWTGALMSGATQVIVTMERMMGKDIGNHIAVRVDNGGDGTAVLFDPGGAYNPPDAEGDRGSGTALLGPDANLRPYVAFHRRAGDQVLILNFDTTPEEEAAIATNFGYGAEGGAYGVQPGFCAITVSSNLAGIGPFSSLSPSYFPGPVANQISSKATSWKLYPYKAK